MGPLGSLIGAILTAFLNSLFRAFSDRRKDLDRVATHERAATAEAGNETQQTIADIADERSNVPNSPTDVVDLAGELRRRKAGPGGGNRKRPF